MCYIAVKVTMCYNAIKETAKVLKADTMLQCYKGDTTEHAPRVTLSYDHSVSGMPAAAQRSSVTIPTETEIMKN